MLWAGCSCWLADPSVSLCNEANVDGYVQIADEVLLSLIACMDEGKRDHYMFLHAALAKCERCLAFGLHHCADLSRGTASHRLGVGSCCQCQSRNLEIADTFRMALSPAAPSAGGGVGHVRARAR